MMKHQHNQLRLLLADDDSQVRAAIAELLQAEGFEIIEAESGLAALEIVRRQTLSCCVMDVDMPGMSGIEVLKIVQTQFGGLPSLLISGNDSRERQIAAMEAGAFSLLAKPVVPDLLRFSIKRMLDHHFGAGF